MMAEPGAAEVLGELAVLRRRTRKDRRGYWVPLLLFGFGVLAAPLVYETDVRQGIGTRVVVESTTKAGAYWVALVTVGAAASLAWYRWRASRVGVQARTGIYVAWLLGALALFVVLVPVVGYLVLGLFDGFSPQGVWVSGAVCVAGGLVAGVSAWRSWRPGMVVGLVAVVLAADQLAILATTHGFGALLVIAVGVCALAWVERSVLCGVIAAVFSAAAVLANLYDMQNVLGGSALVFDNLIVPAAVLLLGGLAGGWRAAVSAA
ncbi:hypothetical protein FPZ12_031670 [Amycolatopsis acidicola]|uniref:Uncharacterized protein n=1 Tax=Amycolatopsis acidicola TaxID=2596893 RepID=A0A5N0UY77_9PSEU|nr:hypothetical protein [Amycolatopsis acidicola]KAA9154585.1 hypothetical protein FPZ12_031670 [Amycolatopsis acidicola]